MSKKIILFLSDKKEKEFTYTCPDGSTVTGVQTCEAPVKYLLRRFPDVSELLCVVTPVAQPALPELERAVLAQSPEVKITAIPFADGEDFSAGPLSQIMSTVKKGDEILLETTGGLRDAIMYLLLVSRALSYSGIPTAGAVYSNLGSKEIVDCSRLAGLFDLIGGMQELSSFGSVRKLREYYRGQDKTEPEVVALLDAMERLKEDITLCRTKRLEERIAAFNAAMEQAERCSDTLMRALLPAFRDKFGRKLTVPGLIRWCIKSNMLQQALTIYKERIPSYILSRKDPVLSVKKNAPSPENKKDYESEDEARFRTQLLTLAMLRDPERYFHLSDFNKGPRVTYSKLQEILMDYAYIRLLRNKINHASEQETQFQSALTELLCQSPRYKNPEQVTTSDITRALENGLDNLKNS